MQKGLRGHCRWVLSITTSDPSNIPIISISRQSWCSQPKSSNPNPNSIRTITRTESTCQEGHDRLHDTRPLTLAHRLICHCNVCHCVTVLTWKTGLMACSQTSLLAGLWPCISACRMTSCITSTAPGPETPVPAYTHVQKCGLQQRP